MSQGELRCSLIRCMLSRHAWGSPIQKEALVNLAAPSEKQGEAKEVFEELREESFTINRGKRGIELDNSEFDILAKFLYYECGWDKYEIELRLKHFEGDLNEILSDEPPDDPFRPSGL